MAVWILRPPRKGVHPFTGATLVTVEQHAELLAAYEVRLARGEDPKAAWGAALRLAKLTLTWLLCCLLEFERLRLRAGLSGDALCERAGLAERAFAKWLRPWASPHCRAPSRTTMTVLSWALAGCDLDQMMRRVRACPLTQAEYEARLASLHVRNERRGNRAGPPFSGLAKQHMARISPLGVAGRKAKLSEDERRRVASMGAMALNASRTPEQRSSAARAAVSARWA